MRTIIPRQHALQPRQSIQTNLYCLLLLSILVGCGGSDLAGQQDSKEQEPRSTHRNEATPATEPENIITDQHQLQKMLIKSEPGTKLYVRVTGDKAWGNWGSGVHPQHSVPSTSAVHDGVLKVGETAVLEITVLQGKDKYPAATRNGVDADNYGSTPKAYIAKYDPNQPKPQPKIEPQGQYQLVLNLQPGKIYEFNQHELGTHSLSTGESLIFDDNITDKTFRPVGRRGDLTSVQVVQTRIKVYKQVSPDPNVPFRQFDTSKPETLNTPTARMFAAKIGEPHLIHLSPDAKIAEFEGVRQVAYKMYATAKTPSSSEVNVMTIDIVHDFDHHLGFYPPKSVDIGDSWDGSRTEDDEKIQATMTYTLNSVSGGVATITGEGTIPAPNDKTAILKSIFKIDRNSGWLINGEETTTITQDIGEGKTMVSVRGRHS